MSIYAAADTSTARWICFVWLSSKIHKSRPWWIGFCPQLKLAFDVYLLPLWVLDTFFYFMSYVCPSASFWLPLFNSGADSGQLGSWLPSSLCLRRERKNGQRKCHLLAPRLGNSAGSKLAQGRWGSLQGREIEPGKFKSSDRILRQRKMHFDHQRPER